MNDKNKHELHVAIIGCGDFAKHFVPLFLAHPTVDSLKVCDIDEKRAREYAKTFNVGIIKTFEDVINDKAINTPILNAFTSTPFWFGNDTQNLLPLFIELNKES